MRFGVRQLFSTPAVHAILWRFGATAAVALCTLLAGHAGAQGRALTPADLEALPAPPPTARVAYGSGPLQFGNLRIPQGPGPHPVVVFIHGGCWLSQYTLTHVAALEQAVADAGYAVWSLEYRRVGDDGGGWPGTYQDIAAGADHLRTLAATHRLDLTRVIASGHSAGGHFALWLAARSRVSAGSELYSNNPLPIQAVLGLAPAPDLEGLSAKGVCGGVIDKLMGGPPATHPDRYRAASPMQLAPVPVPQTLIIGAKDNSWGPVGRAYVQRAQAAGDTQIRVVDAPESGHFEMVAPTSSTWPLVVGELNALAKRQPARAPLSIERLVSAPALAGTAPVAPTWSADSRWLAFLWNDSARPARELWVVGRDSSAPRRLTAPGASVNAFAWSPSANAVYVYQSGVISRIDLRGQVTPIANGITEAGDMAVSPDGRWISLLREGDLWMVPTGGGDAVRVTQVGVPPIGKVPLGTYYGPDVEVGGGTWGGPSYAWSPDSRTIAVHVVDRRAVRTVDFPYTVGAEPIMNQLRRSYPGDTNEVRRVGLVDLSTRALRWLDLPDAANMRVVSLAWSPAGQLLIDRETDDAIDRWIHLASATGQPRVVWHDRRDTRIYNDIASTWHPDGQRILLTGDLDDRYRLYALDPRDSSVRALTSGPADVAGAGQGVAATRSILFVSSAPLPAERHVWRIGADGGTPVRLTSRAGTHAPTVSPDGRTLALISSDDVTPPDLWLSDATRMTEPRRITRSPSPEFASVPWQRARYVSFPARGEPFTLHARIIEPPNLDPTKKYPVLFGPVYSNTVRNRWSGLYGMVQQMLAIEKGYIVVQVDVRGSTGYGRDFREKFLMDWGGRDLDDLEAAADYMKSLPYVDGTRLGIWGSSYGGTLTIYSLLKKPGLFAAGVAAAPATDPYAFGSDDVAIARRPQTHPETFRRGALQYAANLKDHLLIIHGMQDDVVPFRTSVALAEEFMRLGKDFDFAFAPAATHGWTQRPHYARYLLNKLVDHFDRYLGQGSR